MKTHSIIYLISKELGISRLEAKAILKARNFKLPNTKLESLDDLITRVKSRKLSYR